jgi:hypothetical protein
MKNAKCLALSKRIAAGGDHIRVIFGHCCDGMGLNGRRAAQSMIAQIEQHEFEVRSKQSPESAIPIDGKAIAVRQNEAGTICKRKSAQVQDCAVKRADFYVFKHRASSNDR